MRGIIFSQRARGAIGIATLAFMLATGTVGVTPSALAAGAAFTRDATVVRIVSPASGALVTSSHVMVRVRTFGRVSGFRAWLRSRRVQRVDARFTDARHGVRTLKLVRGRDLVLGANHLFIQVRSRSGTKHTAVAHFTVARRQRGLLLVRGVSARTVRAPVVVRARAPRADVLRATLNGRNVRGAFVSVGRGRWQARLEADNGLRFGSDRLTLTAFNRRGIYQRVERTFRLRRIGPLVGAGPNRRVRLGGAVRLDGRSSRASRRDHKLTLRWRIVSRPRGSKARLRNATAARPLLRPDVRGEYTIELRAVEYARSRRGEDAVVTLAGTATDTVTVAAQPDVLPAGVPLATMTSQGGQTGVTLGPTVGVPSAFYPLAHGDWVQMLVLDRATLAPSTSLPSPDNSYPATDAGIAALASDAAKLANTDLVIISADGQPASLDATAQNTLTGVLQGLGAELQPPFGNSAELATGEWSLVGIPGVVQGGAYQSIGLQLDTASPPGSLSGFLQGDTNKNFAFTWTPTFHTFDTDVPTQSPNQNVIRVGVQQYTSQTLPTGESGFHIVVLDPGTLKLEAQYTALDEPSVLDKKGTPNPNCSSAGPIICMDNAADALLATYQHNTPALMVVASIAKPFLPQGASPIDNAPWALMAQEIAAMGGQQYAFLGLDGTGDYSFVGAQGLLQLDGPNSGAELSQPVAGSPSARLTGLLSRNRQGTYLPSTNGSPSAGIDPTIFEPSLERILAQHNRPFPSFNTPAKLAAEEYINEQLGLPPLDPQFGIRANYWLNPNPSFWVAESTALDNLQPCSTFPCKLGFGTVKQELIREFTDVQLVNSYFYGGDRTSLSGLLNSVFLNGAVSFESIGTDITKLYDPPSTSPNGADSTSILNGALSIASGAAGLTPEGGGASSAFSIMGGVEQIIEATTEGEGGNPAMDPQVFQGDIYTWGTNLTNAWTAAEGGLGIVANLLTSDYGRLLAAAQALSTGGSDGGWKLDDTSITALTTSLGRSLQNYMWSTMLPVPAKVLPCTTKQFSGWGTSQFAGRWVSNASKQTIGSVFPILMNMVDVEVLDNQTSNSLFDKSDGLGLEPQYFFAGAWIGSNGQPTTPGFTYLDARSYGDICDVP